MIGYVISKQEKNFIKKIFNKLDVEEYEEYSHCKKRQT